MAYGGGIFVPSETAYKDPNRFRDVLQAEGNKEATYLAQMDQFYAELDEMKREFDITSEQRERFFEEEMAFNREKLDWQSQENELDRSLQRWVTGQQVGVQREALDIRRDEFGEIQENNRFTRDLAMRREDRTQQAFNTYDALFDSYRSSQTEILQPLMPSNPNTSPEILSPYSSSGVSGTSSGFSLNDYSYEDDYYWSSEYDADDWAETLW